MPVAIGRPSTTTPASPGGATDGSQGWGEAQPLVLVGGEPRVRVEFYGLARSRAGRADVWVSAATVGAALAAADAACPGLRAGSDSGVSPEYLVSVGGTRFTTDPGLPLAAGDALLVLGADAGG